jgi:hypothetical protein
VSLHAMADFPFQNPSVQLLIGFWLAHAWLPRRAPLPIGVSARRAELEGG